MDSFSVCYFTGIVMSDTTLHNIRTVLLIVNTGVAQRLFLFSSVKRMRKGSTYD